MSNIINLLINEDIADLSGLLLIDVKVQLEFVLEGEQVDALLLPQLFQAHLPLLI
jgi:hypothetical protein